MSCTKSAEESFSTGVDKWEKSRKNLSKMKARNRRFSQKSYFFRSLLDVVLWQGDSSLVPALFTLAGTRSSMV
jgi:hypothetical protein